MATLIATADGNLTGSTTFAAAEVGALSIVLNRNTTGNYLAAGTSTSTTFTVTNAKVIDGVLLWLKQTAAGSTGTFKVDLQKSAVSQASVTINKTDLPDATSASPCPVFLKFTGTATGDGAATWTLVATTTGTGTVTTSLASATTSNWTRALRTTTTQAPVATDDMYVVGELTGAGTKNTRTVTMDSIAATVYGNGAVNSTTVNGGGIHISNWGTLTYGTTASTAYILRIAGDMIVYQYGALNIISPQTSTTHVLEFQPVSVDGDFGLRCLDNSVVNITGVPRTAGKLVTQCKLTADMITSNIVGTGSGYAATFPLALEATGNSLLSSSLVDNTTNTQHGIYCSGPTLANTTLTLSLYLARGSGLNNRYVRILVGDTNSLTAVTNGFYSDIDLQAGTASGPVVIGGGTATSVSITPLGAGYLVEMTGKVSSGSVPIRTHIAACSGAGTITYAGNTTQCFIYQNITLIAASSIPDTTYSVDADTGWLSGDAICIASTTRTSTECEITPLNANAGSSSFTSALYLSYVHHGTSPIQAEIGLITRNVKIRSTSTTLMSYVYCAALSTVTASWAEFSYVGANSANKRGIEVDGGTTANPKSFTYCSIHDCDNWGFYCLAAASLNVTFSNNVIWNTFASPAVSISAAVSNNNWTFDSNLVMRISNGISLLDIGGTCTNNTVVGVTGASNPAFGLNEANTACGTFDGNTAHSCIHAGFNFQASGISGTINNCKAWRNGNVGVSIIWGGHDLYFTNLTLFGNTTTNFTASNNNACINIQNGLIAGDASYSTVTGISAASSWITILNISNVDMSGSPSPYAPHTTNDFSNAATYVSGVMNNCKFGAPITSLYGKNSSIGMQKYNQVAGDHRTETAYGQLRTDTTIYHT